MRPLMSRTLARRMPTLLGTIRDVTSELGTRIIIIIVPDPIATATAATAQLAAKDLLAEFFAGAFRRGQISRNGLIDTNQAGPGPPSPWPSWARRLVGLGTILERPVRATCNGGANGRALLRVT